MKIISFAFNINYGYILQMFALQKFLEKKSFSVEHLKFFSHCDNYISEKNKQKFPILIWKIIALFKKVIDNLFTFVNYKKLLGSTKIKLTRSFKCDKDNCFIVGSDQVWNQTFIHKMEDIYFLEFAQETSIKLSYAASLGIDKWSPDFEKKILSVLKKFNAISVREESSVSYLKSIGLKNVVCVCDPTILHKAKFYREVFNTSNHSYNTERFYLNYFIREKNIKISGMKHITVNLKSKLVSIDKWLYYIDNSEFVLTDSFHCVVFCILFHKKFIAISGTGKSAKMNERFKTILDKINLEYRLLNGTESKATIVEIINRPIDWKKVDEILDEWRTFSQTWLMDNLNV